MGFVLLNLQFSVSWLVDCQWISVAQYLDFGVMIGGLLVGFVCLNLQFSVSWLVGFQWGSCGSIFSFLCHGTQTFSGLRVSQSLVFCVMVGRLLVGFLWPNLLFSVSWQVDFQWASCVSIFSFLCHGWQTFSGVRVGSIFSFLCHGRQTFSGVRVAQSLCFLCHGWQTFSGVRVVQSLVFCVMVGRLLLGSCGSTLVFCVMVDRLLVGFVWLNLQFSVSWQEDFQWGSCGSIFSFLCHGWQTFSGVRVAQSLVFCVMVGRLLVGFVWLNLQFSVSRLVTFSGVRVAQTLVFCVMVGTPLVGFVWPHLQISASWLVDFQWGS